MNDEDNPEMVCVRTSERASEKDSKIIKATNLMNNKLIKKIISDGQDNRDNMNGSISGGGDGGGDNKKVKYK